MRDDRDGDAEFGAQSGQQPQDLGLDRDIERGRRFVGDEQRGIVRQGDRDHHTLAHTAGELVRILVDLRPYVGNADLFEEFDRA